MWLGDDGDGVVVGEGVLVLVERMGEVSEGGLGQVAAFAVPPFLVLLQQDGSDQAGDAVPVGEDLHDVGAALDLTVETLDGVAGPDLGPVLLGEGRKRGQVRLGLGEHVSDLWERGVQGADDVLVLGGDGLPAGLSEDRGIQGVHGLGAGRAEPGGDVAGEVDPAPLPGRAGQDRLDRGPDAGVGVTGDQHDPLGVLVGGDPQPPLAQGPQEGGPKVGGLGVADSHAQDLATSLGRDPGGDHQGLRDHSVVDPDIHVGGVDEHVGEPGVLQRAGEELAHCLVDVLADP